MKKLISLLLVAAMVLSLGACNAPVNNSGGNAGNNAEVTKEGEGPKEEMGPALKKIKETGKVVMGTSADYPPYEWYGNVDGEKKVMGFDIALAQDIAKELGAELVVQDMDFNGILTALSLGEVDIALAGLVANEERKEQVDFSVPYYSDNEKGQIMMIRTEDKDKYKTKDDFDGVKVAAQQASLQETLAKTLPGAVVDPQVNLNNMVLELKGHTVDAVVIAGNTAEQFIKLNPELMTIDVGFPNDDGSAVAIPKGNEDLVEIVNKVIGEWKESGKTKEQMKHFMELSDQETDESN